MKNILLPFIVLLLASCSSAPKGNYFDVGVSSFARPDASEKKIYVLLPADPSISPEDLQFTEFAAQVERALASRGFQRSNNINSADLAVYVGYGIGAPKEQTYYRYVGTPIWIPQTVNTFDKYVFLIAGDLDEFRKTNKDKSVWELWMTGSGWSNDIRRVFPVYIAAGRSNIATSTGQRIVVRMYENNPAVLEIKGISK